MKLSKQQATNLNYLLLGNMKIWNKWIIFWENIAYQDWQ